MDRFLRVHDINMKTILINLSMISNMKSNCEKTTCISWCNQHPIDTIIPYPFEDVLNVIESDNRKSHVINLSLRFQEMVLDEHGVLRGAKVHLRIIQKNKRNGINPYFKEYPERK